MEKPLLRESSIMTLRRSSNDHRQHARPWRPVPRRRDMPVRPSMLRIYRAWSKYRRCAGGLDAPNAPADLSTFGRIGANIARRTEDDLACRENIVAEKSYVRRIYVTPYLSALAMLKLLARRVWEKPILAYLT